MKTDRSSEPTFLRYPSDQPETCGFDGARLESSDPNHICWICPECKQAYIIEED